MNIEFKKFFSLLKLITTSFIIFIHLNYDAEAARSRPKPTQLPAPEINTAALQDAFNLPATSVHVSLSTSYQGNKLLQVTDTTSDKKLSIRYFRDITEQRFLNASIIYQATKRERDLFTFSVSGRNLICVDSVINPIFRSSQVLSLPRGSKIWFLRESAEHPKFTAHDGFVIEVYLKYTDGTLEKRVFERPNLVLPTWRQIGRSVDIDQKLSAAINQIVGP
jgi:hypothetical protein